MAPGAERVASKRDPGSIFICYRRSDTQGYAGRLQDSLSLHFGDRRIFRDITNMKGGASVSETLDRELATTDATLVLVGSKWLVDENGRRRLNEPDDFVAHELTTVLATDMPVIPVLVEGAPMPRADELPEPSSRWRTSTGYPFATNTGKRTCVASRRSSRSTSRPPWSETSCS